MNDDDVILSDLRRRIEAISIERDNATLALSKVREEEEKKRSRLRADIRLLRSDERWLRLSGELESARIVAREANARCSALEERLRDARRFYRELRADYRALQKLMASRAETAMIRRAPIG